MLKVIDIDKRDNYKNDRSCCASDTCVRGLAVHTHYSTAGWLASGRLCVNLATCLVHVLYGT